MKKIIATILCLVCAFTVSVSVCAEESPKDPVKYEVTLFRGSPSGGLSKAGEAQIISNGETVTATSIASEGTFNSWTIYKVTTATGTSGENETGVISLSASATPLANISAATEGTDYVLVSGSLTSSTLTIKPLTSLIICANYNNQITDPVTGAAKKADSPKTGSNTAMIFAIVMLGAAAVTFGAKKSLAK